MGAEGAASDPVQDRLALQTLLARKKTCEECVLCRTRTRVVLPSLPERAIGRVLWLGRNPGRTEDLEGRPFVGTAGMELTRWFKYLGWNREDDPIENVVACYTPDDCEPDALETITCGQWLREEIALLRPSLIVALGATAQSAIDANGKHGELVMCRYGYAYLLWHPSYLCRDGHDALTVKALHRDLDGLKKAVQQCEKIASYRAMNKA